MGTAFLVRSIMTFNILLKYVPPVNHKFLMNLEYDDKTTVDIDYELISDEKS